VREALATCPVHVLQSVVVQRIVFAETAAQWQTVFEIDTNGLATAEIEAVAAEPTGEHSNYIVAPLLPYRPQTSFSYAQFKLYICSIYMFYLLLKDA
jgi:hypothetical protein